MNNRIITLLLSITSAVIITFLVITGIMFMFNSSVSFSDVIMACEKYGYIQKNGVKIDCRVQK